MEQKSSSVSNTARPRYILEVRYYRHFLFDGATLLILKLSLEERQLPRILLLMHYTLRNRWWLTASFGGYILSLPG